MSVRARPGTLARCEDIYRQMDDEALDLPSYGRVWSGSLYKLVEQNFGNHEHYEVIKKHLRRMGCIRSLMKPGHPYPKWLLLRAPSDELFNSGRANDLSTMVDRAQSETNLLTSALLRIEELETRLVAAEKWQKDHEYRHWGEARGVRFPPPSETSS